MELLNQKTVYRPLMLRICRNTNMRVQAINGHLSLALVGDIRILRPIIGIACGVSKVIAADGAKLASLFLSFIQL